MNQPDPQADRAIGRILFATRVFCLVAALFWRNMPAPILAAAPAEKFSAERAQAVVAQIAQAPHPVESKELARVRGFLVEHLGSLGFAPEMQPDEIGGVQLTNLLLRIPGSAPSGTLLCLAHCDTVPGGPGASDDSAGMACWMETFRTLRARRWHPKNDVLVLLAERQGP